MRRGRLVKVLALLLLALIAGDALFDANCDPLSAPAGAASLRSAGPAGDEPCGRFCVPDCYCCSATLVTAPTVLARGPAPRLWVGAPARPAALDGIPAVLYHPPLAPA